MKRVFSSLLFFYMSATSLKAQVLHGKNEIGISGGVMVYEGDLAPALGSYKTPKPAFSMYYNRLLNNYFSVRGTVGIGGLRSDESMYPSKAYRLKRNFDFSSSVKEISGMVIFNIFGDNAKTSGIKLSPYIFTGIGVSFLNIKRNWSNMNVDDFHSGSAVLQGLAIDTVHALPSSAPFIPLGLGIKYPIGHNLSLSAEGSYRFLFTDYLDGFSYSAGPGRKDGYYTLSIGLTYNFGKNKLNCPTVK
ncbi:DUF6089 family protein [Parafilimonas sp.]|uniref:DUF6089 family protein n=1 Tax=Parafilimonas sp. TaxID=1969739 RepID=UPI0039E5C8C8